MGRVSKRTSAPAVAVKEAKICYKAGIYARLSSDQDNKTLKGHKVSKNESVEVQVKIAEKYIEDFNREGTERIEIADRYVDLGKTGSNFNRDEFQRLMQDIRLGSIDCVVVKDLSRFGRNYLEAGNYIEKIFPFLGVRFIAVADGLDTGMRGSNTKQMAAEIVRYIFALALSGNGSTQIARILNEKGIPTKTQMRHPERADKDGRMQAPYMKVTPVAEYLPKATDRKQTA